MFKNYISLTKPRICLMVAISAYLGYYLALRVNGSYMLQLDEWIVFFHLMVGTLLSSAGACTLNQAIEYKSDLKMERTKERAIPKGYISPFSGLIFGIICSSLGIFYLEYYVNSIVSFLSLLTVICYILLYTPLKRVTYLNTLVGAIPGALPPVGGWFAVSNDFSLITVVLFSIMFCWQIPHFLALAYMYSDDYKRGGFIMLPSLYSNQIQTRVHVVFFTFILISITFSLYFSKVVGMSYLFLNMLLSSGFIYAVVKFSINVNIKTARQLFFASIIYLPMLLLLIIIAS